VCSSGGNAGLAAAYAARKLNVPCTVYVPKTTPESVHQKLRDEVRVIIAIKSEMLTITPKIHQSGCYAIEYSVNCFSGH
jgi:threonine dehydratase